MAQIWNIMELLCGYQKKGKTGEKKLLVTEKSAWKSGWRCQNYYLCIITHAELKMHVKTRVMQLYLKQGELLSELFAETLRKAPGNWTRTEPRGCHL